MNKIRGFSILEILIAIGIIAVLSLALATTAINQQKEMKSLTQKSEILELKANLFQSLNIDQVCTWQFKDQTIDTTNVSSTQKSNTTLSFNKLFIGPDSNSAIAAQLGQKLMGTQSGLVVSAISFENIFATGMPDEYVGSLTIQFTDQSLVRSLKPAQIQKIVHVIGTDPVSAKRIDKCVVATYSQTFTVPTVILKTYHSGVNVDCSNMNTEKMFFDSACSRYCSKGCLGADSTCTATTGQGFVSGLANECNGVAGNAQCFCLR